jgi:DNA-binding LacI/PurR family transcriptional regulator
VQPKQAPIRDRPTLDTIARALGVSRATVSNAYNRPDQLSPALRERILATAASLGYGGPDPAARSLRQRRVGAVGVLMSDRLSLRSPIRRPCCYSTGWPRCSSPRAQAC